MVCGDGRNNGIIMETTMYLLFGAKHGELQGFIEHPVSRGMPVKKLLFRLLRCPKRVNMKPGMDPLNPEP